MFYFFIPFLRMRHHFIGNFEEEAPFNQLFERRGAILLGRFGRRLMEFFSLMSRTMLEVGWSFILLSMIHLEGWSSRSSYFIGMA